MACNWRGDVVRIYDSTGALIANYDYDAWGSVSSVTDAASGYMLIIKRPTAPYRF